MNEMKPWMMEDQIKLVEKIFLSFGKKKINALEWGAGGSTLYFTRFLENHGIDYNWYSIEHRVKWYNIIEKEINTTKIKLILKKQKADNRDWQTSSCVHRYSNLLYRIFPRISPVNS